MPGALLGMSHQSRVAHAEGSPELHSLWELEEAVHVYVHANVYGYV